MNPEHFDIETLKSIGMWPNANLISRGIAPYIRRLKKEKVSVIFVGDKKGEQVADLIELCGDKIEKVCVVNDYEGDDAEILKSLFKKNTVKYADKITTQVMMNEGDVFDVVCIDEFSCNKENFLLTYSFVPSNGIFCGGGHETNTVKSALNEFRRGEKIGTPIQVSNRAIWFWNKR